MSKEHETKGGEAKAKAAEAATAAPELPIIVQDTTKPTKRFVLSDSSGRQLARIQAVDESEAIRLYTSGTTGSKFGYKVVAAGDDWQPVVERVPPPPVPEGAVLKK